jgi:hypothetical protein
MDLQHFFTLLIFGEIVAKFCAKANLRENYGYISDCSYEKRFFKKSIYIWL